MFPTTDNTLSTSFRSSESEKPLRNKEARTNSHHAMHDEDLLYTTTIHNVPQVGGCRSCFTKQKVYGLITFLVIVGLAGFAFFEAWKLGVVCKRIWMS